MHVIGCAVKTWETPHFDPSPEEKPRPAPVAGYADKFSTCGPVYDENLGIIREWMLVVSRPRHMRRPNETTSAWRCGGWSETNRRSRSISQEVWGNDQVGFTL